MRTLLLGEFDRVTNVESTTAWKSYGYNLDGLTTTRASSDVCTTDVLSNQVDGVGGIDNAFGSVILPIIQTGGSFTRPSDNVTQRIAAGQWTLLIQVTGLSAEESQSAIGLSAQTFVGTRVTSNPTFDTTTDWPVSPQSIVDGVNIASGASVRFSTVYVTDGVVVARDATQPLALPIQFTTLATLVLRIHQPIITFDATSSNGTIAGVLDVAEAVSAGRPFGEQLDRSVCGSAYDGIAQQVVQGRDILVDGTNKSGVDCNAISIGLGFTANEVANPSTVGTDPPTPPSPCDAGTD